MLDIACSPGRNLSVADHRNLFRLPNTSKIIADALSEGYLFSSNSLTSSVGFDHWGL